MKVDNWDDYLFRCSSLGHIMVDPKNKHPKLVYNSISYKIIEKEKSYYETKNKETKAAVKMSEQLSKLYVTKNKLEPLIELPFLSDGCKIHLADIYTAVTTGRTQDIRSKYMTKGLHVEEDAITTYSLFDNQMYSKNKLRMSNDFIEGECDILTEFRIDDTKASWDAFTFNRVRAKPILPLYHWQVDGYMWLYNKKEARVVPTLVNTPQFLLDADKKKLKYEMFGSEINYNLAPDYEKDRYDHACNEIDRSGNFDDLPIDERVIIFTIKRDDERIDRIKERIKECRKFLNNFRKIKTDEYELDDSAEEMAA